MNYYYQVKYGHKDSELVSITRDELMTAVKAQVTGKVGVFNEGTVSGNSIIAIIPDYIRMMGWNRGYVLTSEDWGEINSSNACREAKLLLEETSNQVRGISSNKPKEISGVVKELASKMRV